jgi:fatty-acyl-CoA synthase
MDLSREPHHFGYGAAQRIGSIYDQHLDRNAANFAALSPVSFVERSAEVFGDLPAVVHGQRRYTWARCANVRRGWRRRCAALGVGAAAP